MTTVEAINGFDNPSLMIRTRMIDVSLFRVSARLTLQPSNVINHVCLFRERAK